MPMRSPPICAIGRRTLIASRMNLREAHVRSCGRVFDGKSSHQPIPATETVTPRTITTRKIPQPTPVTVWPTASSSLLKNPRHSECIVIQFFYHESGGGWHAGRIYGSGWAVFVHRARGAGAGEPSAEEDPGACARCTGRTEP